MLLAHSSLHWMRLALLILPQTLAQEQNDNWLPLAAMNKIAEVRGAAGRGAGVRPMDTVGGTLSGDAGRAGRIGECATRLSQLTSDSARAAVAESLT